MSFEETETDSMSSISMDKGEVPITILEPKSINDSRVTQTLRALLDSGASITCIYRGAIPPDIVPHSINGCTVFGFGGSKVLKEVAELQNVSLPEFSRSFKIERIQALITDDKTNYDIIVGRDVLNPAGFILDFKKGIIQWMTMEVRMKENIKDRMYHIDYVSDEEDDDEELFITKILSSKYDEVKTDDVAEAQTHLTEEQMNE